MLALKADCPNPEGDTGMKTAVRPIVKDIVRRLMKEAEKSGKEISKETEETLSFNYYLPEGQLTNVMYEISQESCPPSGKVWTRENTNQK